MSKLYCLFDTSIASSNVGDFIIMDAVKEQLSKIDTLPQFVSLPTHDSFGKEGRNLLSQSEISIVGGTNLLSSHFLKYKQWRFKYMDLPWLSNCVLMGVGWWQYQATPDIFTSLVWKHVLHKQMLHSVRDSFTESQLKSIGIDNVINTGCPTMWNLTPEHCDAISVSKSNAVVFTLTDYNQDRNSDLKLISALKNSYQDIYFWPQGSGDIAYFETLPREAVGEIKMLTPHLHSLNAMLVSGKIDYVGTRLHAGIRALQRKVRSLIIGIDNRAIEKSKDFGLPVLPRDNIDRLGDLLCSPIHLDIRLPEENILMWKKQFK
ncbi:Polysaccharide pyruvyl transferase [compost metagenome]